MPRLHRTHVLALLIAAAVAIPVAGCGSDDKAATTTTTSPTKAAAAQTCKARSDLQTALKKAGDEAKAGNLGNAATALKDASSSAADVASSAKDLTAAQKDKIQPYIEDLTNEFKSLPSLTSGEDLKASVDKMQSDVDATLNALGGNLNC